MALKKQSIRTKHHILANGNSISKEELILISENWSEIQENFFRKTGLLEFTQLSLIL